MIKHKLVFCEFGFLDRFIQMCPSMAEFNDESANRMLNWLSLYKFISKSNIYLDISHKEMVQHVESSLWLKNLWKKAVAGECCIECISSSFPAVSKISSAAVLASELNAVYLTMETNEVCAKLANDFGVIVINPDIVFRTQHLFKDNGTAFPSSRAQKWDFMSPLKYSFPGIDISNTMLIIDPYLLKDNTNCTYQEKIECNLKPILQVLLPRKLAEISYHIYIFSGEKDDGTDINEQYDYLKSTIASIRKDLNYTLTIFYKCKEFHDRSIITNNVVINCGLGFDVFNKKGKARKSTNVSIVYPFIQSQIEWVDDSYSNILKDVRKVFERYNDKYNCIDCSSIPPCRLYEEHTVDKKIHSRAIEPLAKEIESANGSLKLKIVGKIEL